MQVSVEEAREKLPELITLVENGELITITRNQIPVAEASVCWNYVKGLSCERVEVSLEQAREKWPELITRVERGELITITRDEIPVADLMSSIGREGELRLGLQDSEIPREPRPSPEKSHFNFWNANVDPYMGLSRPQRKIEDIVTDRFQQTKDLSDVVFIRDIIRLAEWEGRKVEVVREKVRFEIKKKNHVRQREEFCYN